MRFYSGAIVTSLAVVLSACSTPISNKSKATVTTADKTAISNEQKQAFNDLQNWLPGFYSNYSQVVEAGGLEHSVIGLTIRQLPTESETAFLFESSQRDSDETDYDLYFAKLNAQSGQLELHFSRLTGSELSMTLADTLAIGWQRAIPGCVISLTSSDGHLAGKSNSETCRFEDPVNGQVAVERSLSISSKQIDLTGEELIPGEVIEEQPVATQFQQHQAYEATVRLNPAILAEDSSSAEWQTSMPYNFYDDGRIRQLYDTDMQPMKYTIRLSRLHWREQEPDYLRLEMVLLESGEAQAYSWFSPDSKQIEWELDWATVRLKELNLPE